MKIGVITTSRADFGIYLPLLKKIKERSHELSLFVGGMHTAAHLGNSYHFIEKEGFQIAEKIDGVVEDDSSAGIVQSMSLTMIGFSKIWKKYRGKLDVVFVLGDRFEMYAATSSLIPFNFKIAHIHGGETTLGAIDNKFRNAMTMLSDLHFTSHEKHALKVAQMKGGGEGVYNVGALGVENLLSQQLLDKAVFFEKFKFSIARDYILCTIHPETVALGNNKFFIEQFIEAVKEVGVPLLCTLPNADTEGVIIRQALLEFEKHFPEKIKCFENLGIAGYLTAMKNCTMMLGNTSSGIIEAASFHKGVINLGDRQKGRYAPENVLHVPFNKEAILVAVKTLLSQENNWGVNPYEKSNSAEEIVKILETVFI